MSPTFPIIAVAALGLAACDISHKKPETTAAAAARAPVQLAPTRELLGPRPAAADAQPDAASRGGAEGERSIRLHGPGVTRERQTGV
jgi:hypothetical protein